MFPDEKFPDYICGIYYVMSRDAALEKHNLYISRIFFLLHLFVHLSISIRLKFAY